MNSGKSQKQALAVAYAIKRRNMKAMGGMINSGEALNEADLYEQKKEMEPFHKAPVQNEISSKAQLKKAENYELMKEPADDMEAQGEESDPQSMHMESEAGLSDAKSYELDKEKQGMKQSGSGMLPMSMMAHGGMMHPKNMAKAIMVKKYGMGGPVDSDSDDHLMMVDGLSPHEDFLSEVEQEPSEELKKKSLLQRIMSDLHSRG